ncbi:hypothetical protein Gp_4 [Bacillus phage vB_Bacillus_1020A]|uniref:hypothetical protein n=1 Tax=Robertmurraya sp. DFI.2.37 TaxID=3031819 RepID=UPI001482535E|nr:hypothetical protein [Robertmurraya sp. DFI.2.37]MDF1511450.1 hypothetical protein [Robertmurraya sp. DFI.2.37]QIW89278.1 hypothetical protein Gp_4 [Bacillus phage vB_Bacillus_1020A]
MDISKATNQQLYEIAKDDGARMKERYAATKELQRRKQEKANEALKVDIQNQENRWF